jgi:DMSO/TMAO reductase YedYZ molybdopterin-dependent catalytic subunit
MKSRLPPGQQLAAPGKWPIIGEKTPAASDGPWQLRVTGLVQRELEFGLGELATMPLRELLLDIHCVTRWSIFDMRFSGVSLNHMLELASPLPAARFVSFVSHSERNHSTSLLLYDAIKLETLIATHANDEEIATNHGGPIRNIVPGRYFYKSVKWLKEIRLLENDELGMWEKESGYHNTADPWLEQRYMAPTIDKRTAAQLIESQDFSNRDLRSIQCNDRDLLGLNARNALLRDSNFQRAILARADFSGANLSNAHFELADLHDAMFRGSDVEGASFNGANLLGVDLSDVSLIGGSFFGEFEGQKASARIDNTTTFRRESLESLASLQREFVLGCSPRLI